MTVLPSIIPLPASLFSLGFLAPPPPPTPIRPHQLINQYTKILSLTTFHTNELFTNITAGNDKTLWSTSEKSNHIYMCYSRSSYRRACIFQQANMHERKEEDNPRQPQA